MVNIIGEEAVMRGPGNCEGSGKYIEELNLILLTIEVFYFLKIIIYHDSFYVEN